MNAPRASGATRGASAKDKVWDNAASRPNDLKQSIAILQAGGVLIYETETFCALGCVANAEKAINAIYAIKRRQRSKPLPLLACDAAQVAEIADLDEAPEALWNAFWPGPLSLCLPCHSRLPPEIVSETGQICLRVSGSRQARELARNCGRALAATSANLSGRAAPATLSDIDQTLSSRAKNICVESGLPFGVLTPEEIEPKFPAPSTVIETRKRDRAADAGWTLRVIREGAINKAMLKALATRNPSWEII